MDFLNVACPHCNSAVRVSADCAGQQVVCPVCQGGFSAPDGSANASLVKFACPFCTEPFQVEEASLGSAVQCPNCDSAVALPERDAADEPDVDPGEPLDEVSPASGEHQTEPERATVESLAPSVLPSEVESERGSRKTNLANNRPDIRQVDSAGVTPKSQSSSEADTLKELGKRIDDLLPPKFALDLPGIAFSAIATDSNVIQPSVRSSKFVTVRIDGEDVQLRRLSPEEVASRRTTRNVIMFIVGAVLLAILGVLLRQ